jgi:3-phosphoshikimate 1-carboxyvinyltransferase
MGCIVSRRDGEIEVTGPPGRLQAIDEDLSGAPDGAMAVAVAALFADGPSRLRGLSTLRLKETDRLAALETELGRVGGEARVDGEILEVGPGRLRPAEVETYDDHRMAMAMALVGLVEPGIVILDPGTVSKTWPGYFEMLSAL